MNAQVNNIVTHLSTLTILNLPQAAEVKEVITKLPNDRHVLAALRCDADHEELLSLYGRRFLQRLGYDDKDAIYQSTAQLGMMIINAWADAEYLRNNPGAEDFGYTRSNQTYGHQCGHHSDHPIYCSVCGKDTKEFTGMSFAEMMEVPED